MSDDPMHLSSPEENDPDQFYFKAKMLIVAELLHQDPFTDVPDIYVVWFTKTLQNWKALLSTSIPDGRYFEVTYDGNKKLSYVDTYVKQSNHAISDELLEGYTHHD